MTDAERWAIKTDDHPPGRVLQIGDPDTYPTSSAPSCAVHKTEHTTAVDELRTVEVDGVEYELPDRYVLSLCKGCFKHASAGRWHDLDAVERFIGWHFDEVGEPWVRTDGGPDPEERLDDLEARVAELEAAHDRLKRKVDGREKRRGSMYTTENTP